MDINLPHFPVKTNFNVPTKGRSVRIVGLTGEPIVINRHARKHGKLKLIVKKLTFIEQMESALTLLDTNFELMEAHQAHKRDPSQPQPVYPEIEVPCRNPLDFQAGNWSRFACIWMIYISNFIVLFPMITYF